MKQTSAIVLGELIKYLEQIVPLSYACDWDNCGLQVGRRDKLVSRVYVALDATDAVVEDAVGKGCDLLLTHHPLIFKPIKSLTDDSFIGRRLLKMAGNDMAYYAMHTNFDAVPEGMADTAALLMELKDQEPLEVMGDHLGVPWGIGKVGTLSQPCTVEELCGLVKERFLLDYVVVYPSPGQEQPVSRVAVCPGSGRSVIGEAVQKGVQVLITGDIGHHEGIDAAAMGVTIVDAGHHGLEKIFVPVMAERLKEVFPGLVVEMASPTAPCRVY